jgi:hypothetical protein
VKNLRLLLSGLFIISSAAIFSAQDTNTSVPSANLQEPQLKGKPVWIIGIHGVVVDDDGETFKNLFNVGNSWNFLPYPTRLSVERSLDKRWRVEAAFAYTKYKTGVEINDVPATESKPVIIFDVNAKYDLNSLFGETGIFDPYTVSGIGFTNRAGLGSEHKKATPTVNLGLGFNIWVYKGFGLCLQTTAKFKMIPKSSNYLMHSAGIVYNLGYVDNAEPKGGSIREVR